MIKLGKLKPLVKMHDIGPAALTSKPWQDTRRGSRHDRGYGTDWDRLRLRILERDRYLCQCRHCKQAHRLRPASHCDHIVSKEEWKILHGTLAGSDDPSNLQAMNHACHLVKTAEDRASIASLISGSGR